MTAGMRRLVSSRPWRSRTLSTTTAQALENAGSASRHRTRAVAPLRRRFANTATLGAPVSTAPSASTKLQAAAQLKVGPKWRGEGNYVFTRPDGRPIEPNSISREFRLAVAAAGLRHIRLHDLRHTRASLLLADGEPIGNVSRRIGHADSQITA